MAKKKKQAEKTVNTTGSKARKQSVTNKPNAEPGPWGIDQAKYDAARK